MFKQKSRPSLASTSSVRRASSSSSSSLAPRRRFMLPFHPSLIGVTKDDAPTFQVTSRGETYTVYVNSVTNALFVTTEQGDVVQNPVRAHVVKALVRLVARHISRDAREPESALASRITCYISFSLLKQLHKSGTVPQGRIYTDLVRNQRVMDIPANFYRFWETQSEDDLLKFAYTMLHDVYLRVNQALEVSSVGSGYATTGSEHSNSNREEHTGTQSFDMKDEARVQKAEEEEDEPEAEVEDKDEQGPVNEQEPESEQESEDEYKDKDNKDAYEAHERDIMLQRKNRVFPTARKYYEQDANVINKSIADAYDANERLGAHRNVVATDSDARMAKKIQLRRVPCSDIANARDCSATREGRCEFNEQERTCKPRPAYLGRILEYLDSFPTKREMLSGVVERKERDLKMLYKDIVLQRSPELVNLLMMQESDICLKMMREIPMHDDSGMVTTAQKLLLWTLLKYMTDAASKSKSNDKAKSNLLLQIINSAHYLHYVNLMPSALKDSVQYLDDYFPDQTPLHRDIKDYLIRRVLIEAYVENPASFAEIHAQVLKDTSACIRQSEHKSHSTSASTSVGLRSTITWAFKKMFGL